MFRARLPSIFSISHKMPRLPRNLHLVAAWRSPANAIRKNTQRDTSKVLRLPRKMTMDTSKVLRLPRKLQRIFWRRRKSIAPATQNDFRHVTKHIWMSRSAMPATQTEATPHMKPPKTTPSAEFTVGTAIWPSRGRLRTVANGCGRLRMVEQCRANTPSTPKPETRTLATQGNHWFTKSRGVPWVSCQFSIPIPGSLSFVESPAEKDTAPPSRQGQRLILVTSSISCPWGTAIFAGS